MCLIVKLIVEEKIIFMNLGNIYQWIYLENATTKLDVEDNIKKKIPYRYP